ncbi:MAG: hypothetical protein IH898_13260 [Planctomycetes bacterium]|nr:hypothetical protein [Planctomycetota bacterium]
MDHSTDRSERITVILSTIVAVAILAAGVTAQRSRSAPTDELVHLASDLRFQLESAFRLNPKEGVERVEQVKAVLASWRQAPQTGADRRLLADWLLEATIRSMPGSIEPLPSAPQFGQSESAAAPPAPQSVDASPQSPAKISPVVNADALDQPSKSTPVVATTAVSSASSDALAEQLPVDPIPIPEEHPFVEVSTKVARPETQPITPQVAEPVEINLTELSARIAGYHRGLDEVEAALLVHERPQFERLSRQIHLLEGLTKDFQFVRLYYESLSPAKRRPIGPPRSMEATLSELHRYLNRLEREVQADFLGEFDTAMAKRLAHLRNQLDAIASRVDW